MGRRCTYCGGLMISANDKMQQRVNPPNAAATINPSLSIATDGTGSMGGQQMAGQQGIPTLTLYNPSLDIRLVGINGAIIGRRQGPYAQVLEGNLYISGVHAQLIYKPESGWSIIDKHSSNGTKLNQRDLLPDVPMTIKSGDIVTLANVNLQVTIS